jgi:excisionase family DNA binding protein
VGQRGAGFPVTVMTARVLSEIRPVPRRGLSRDEAAMYIGISAGKFDELVADGRMPAPVRIDGRKILGHTRHRSGVRRAFEGESSSE